MEPLASFGEWLRRRRTALGLTRPELANCAGCSVSALRKIEADERRPSRQLAELLAGCLQVPAEEQSSFVEAARGMQQVARLPTPQSLVTVATGTQAQAFTPFWNLPTPATPLIGREAELETLVHLLANADCRLLTLLGPGGIGKTRLALEAACAVWNQFGGNVYFVPLEAVASAGHIVPAMGQGMRINFAGSVDLRQQLINVLRNKQALLFLDNFEHLLDGVDLLAEILEKAPGVKLLVTSRQRLQLRGEWGFEVQGLPTPGAEQSEGLESYSAVQLFLQRVRRSCSDFEPTAEDKPHIVRICRLVEGMPLALEFAAAWAPVLSCQEIAAEIERGLDILATTMYDVPERQRSLRAVFDHSWLMLNEEEQRALRQMSVFPGGFRREAARAIAGADLVVISSLLAKSFLRRTSAGQFSMHDLVRQYAAEQLARDDLEAQETRDRHALYYIDFVARLEKDLKSARQHDALVQMDEEAGNIRRAWRRAVKVGEPIATGKAVRALWYYYDIRGWFQEAHEMFCWGAHALKERFAPIDDAPAEPYFLYHYLRAEQGWFRLRLGHFEKAEQLLEASVSALRSTTFRTWLVDALQHAGALQRLMGNYERSRTLYEAMHQAALESNDPWNAAIAWGDIGLAALAMGFHEEARRYMTASVDDLRALGDSRMLGVAVHFLGAIHCAMGAYSEADACLQESLRLSRDVGDRWAESMTLRELGNVAWAEGALSTAVHMFAESLRLARDIGEHWCILQALNCLGAVHMNLGEDGDAYDAFQEALAMSWEMQALPDVLAALCGLTQWSVHRPSSDGALQRALAEAVFLLEQPAMTQTVREAAQRLERELLSSLPEAQICDALKEAGSLSLEAMVANRLAAWH